MITCSASSSEKDLAGIIELQKINLFQNLNADEIKSEGFVTVIHSLDDLKKMSLYEENIILKDDEKVIGYLLAMTKNSKSDIPVLVSMFETFDKITYHNKFISEYNYIVVGQVCIDKKYRGTGMLGNCYTAYKKHFEKTYDFAITEIAAPNQRSINAHKKIGFAEIHRFTDVTNTEWSIVIWDWKKN